jgi:glycosyltransferase involved in cell wall biosynthesis
MARVSVLMSVFNTRATLDEAVRSVLSQSLSEVEFIFFDDASNDGSREILEGFAKSDPRIKLFRNESNLGLTRSLNLALSNASGEYCARMDADDISLPHRFSEQVRYLDAHKDAVLIGSSTELMNEEGLVFGVGGGDPSAIARLHSGNCFVHGTIMFRTAVARSVGGYDESFRYAQDYDFIIRMQACGRLQILTTPLYRLRIGRQSISNRKMFEQIRCVVAIKLKHFGGNRSALGLKLMRAYEWAYTWAITYRMGLPRLLVGMKNHPLFLRFWK